MKSYSKKAKRSILTGSMALSSIMVLTMITISSCTSFDPDNPEDVMNKLADNYADRIYDLGYIAPAMYAETAKVDGVYGNLTLKKGYLHSAGYDCLIPVANFSFIASETAKSDRSDDWLAYLTNTYDILDYEHVSDIQPIIQSSFTMVRFFEQRAVLADPKLFDLELDSDQKIIRFEGRESSAYTGKIHYDNEHNITKISLDRIPFYQPVFQNWITVQADISFKMQKKRLFINEIAVEHNTDGVDYKSSIIVEEAIELNRLVSDREFKILEQYKQNPLVHYNGNSLTEYANSFNWLSAESLKEDLEKQIPLEDQFIQNSGKPYREVVSNQRGNMTPFYENEIYPEIRSLLRYMETLAVMEDY